jgi:hypothetical protein
MVFEADLSWYMSGTYVSSNDILLEACLLDVLENAFGMWISYTLGHIVDKLMRW